jgi:hypothetical protein
VRYAEQKGGFCTAMKRTQTAFLKLCLMSYFVYGCFGVIYQWIKYDFDETPEQVQKHISDTLGGFNQRLLSPAML